MTLSRLRFTLFLLYGFSLSAADVRVVAGTVINAATNAPFSMAHVIVTRTGTNRAVGSVVTGDDGRFSFNLPEGKYHLYAGFRDSLQIYGKPRPDAQVGSTLFVGPNLDTSQLVFRWYPPVAIVGKVVDSDGEPVENALIQLVRASVTAGRRRTATAGWAYTDDQGEYRFGSLAAGAFYLTANGEPWYAKTLWPAESANQRQPAYRTVHFSNVYDAGHATAIVLKLGAEARADFTFTETTGATVTVKHNAPLGFRGTVGLLAEGIGATQAFQREAGAVGTSQLLPNVPPG